MESEKKSSPVFDVGAWTMKVISSIGIIMANEQLMSPIDYNSFFTTEMMEESVQLSKSMLQVGALLDDSLIRYVAYMAVQSLGDFCKVGLMKVFMKHDYNSFGVGAHLFAFGFTKESELGAEVVGTFVLVYIVFSATDRKKSPCDSHIPKTVEAVAGVVAFLHGVVGSTARTDIGTFTDFDGADCPAQASRGHDELIVPNMTLVIDLGKHEAVLAGASSPKMEAMVAMVVDRPGLCTQ